MSDAIDQTHRSKPDALPRVLVLLGGPDHERAVSLESGHAVADALQQSGCFEVLRWDLKRPSLDGAPLDHCDCVFPVLHGPWGEGGPLQRLLEQAGVPFVGSTQEPARLAMDKLRSKQHLSAAKIEGFMTPIAAVLGVDDACPLPCPLVVKPNDEGSSVGVRICRDTASLRAARTELHDHHPRLLIEQFIEGREITVGVIEGTPLPVIEIVPGEAFYDYDAKYHRDDTQYRVNPDDIDAAVLGRCQAVARQVFARIGCRDLARVDFMLGTDDQGRVTPWFLEVNTMPGFTSHSLLPMAARAAGRDMPELCADLARAALARGPLAPSDVAERV